MINAVGIVDLRAIIVEPRAVVLGIKKHRGHRRNAHLLDHGAEEQPRRDMNFGLFARGDIETERTGHTLALERCINDDVALTRHRAFKIEPRKARELLA